MADSLGDRAQWLHSYVTDDKLYCVYIADDESTVLEHGNSAASPLDTTARVRRTIDPATGE